MSADLNGDERADEREVRAARNQALFRAVNERIRDVTEGLASITETFVIACECADIECIETLAIPPDEYVAVRGEPRQFAVLPGHVYPDVERVVEERDAYVVVEKTGAAAEVVEALDPQPHPR